MRVLFCNRDDALSRPGGDTIQMEQTAHALEKRGVRVEIQCGSEINPRDFDLVHIFNMQVPAVARRQMAIARQAHKPIALSTIYWEMKSFWSSQEFLSYQKDPFLKRIARISPKWAGRYFIWQQTSRSPHFHEMRQLLLDAHILLPNSTAELELLVRDFDCHEARGKAAIVPNAVAVAPPPDTLSSVSETALARLPEHFVLQVARIEPVKGQLTLIRALDRYMPDVPLVLIGLPGDEDYAQDVKDALSGRPGSVSLGNIPHQELPAFYARARVHALPSYRESPGLATLEAGLAGCNCVAGIHAPTQEYFSSHVWLCVPGHVDSVGKAVLDAWHEPRQSAFASFISNNFTWEQAALRTFEAYQRLLAR